MPRTDKLPHEMLQNLARNRDGRLSTRQRMELITEPLTTLLLLAVPLILLAGRYGPAGRIIVVALVVGFFLTMTLRAWRFARVKLRYRVLYSEGLPARWMFWRKTTLASKAGEPVRFNHRLSGKLKIKPDQALHVYYVEAVDRRILLNMVPQKHPQADAAEPSEYFERAGGILYAD